MENWGLSSCFPNKKQKKSRSFSFCHQSWYHLVLSKFSKLFHVAICEKMSRFVKIPREWHSWRLMVRKEWVTLSAWKRLQCTGIKPMPLVQKTPPCHRKFGHEVHSPGQRSPWTIATTPLAGPLVARWWPWCSFAKGLSETSGGARSWWISGSRRGTLEVSGKRIETRADVSRHVRFTSHVPTHRACTVDQRISTVYNLYSTYPVVT